MVNQISEDMIREAAYFLWEKAGRPDGSAEYFWMKACEQFFKPKKVEIKKPCAKKPTVKVVVKPAAKVKMKPVEKVMIKVQAKPAKTAKKKPVAKPFYGSKK